MPAQLVALSEGPNILLDKPIMLFGRNPECDIQIDSRKVSRRHCCIAQVNDYLVVRDLGSTNGIRINGVRVIEGRIKAGDELTIGSHRYQVRWDALDGGRAAPSLIGAPPPPAPRKANPVPATVNDDELEECDEPVPLMEEEDDAPRPGVPRPVVTALNEDKDDDEEIDDASRMDDDEQVPFVLPENLDLAPNSDIVRPDRAP